MIIAKSKLQLNDIKLGLEAISASNRSLILLKYIGIIQIALGIGTFILSLWQGKFAYSAIFMIGIGLFFVFIIKILAGIQAKKIVKGVSAITEETTYQFSSEGYEAKADTYSVKNSWQKVAMVKETKMLVLIFTNTQVAVIIQKEGFENFEEFKTLIKSIEGLKTKWL